MDLASYTNEHSNKRNCKSKQLATELSGNFENISLDNELRAPICNLDIEEWLDSFTSDQNNHEASFKSKTLDYDEISNEPKTHEIKSNLVESIDVCSSLEDLVKTFDQNVKKCLSDYKDIDIGQLAPVQVRSQEQLMNESQMWYTLTGNFGNLLPIPSDYGSKSLYKKYHKDSLDIKDKKKSAQKISTDTDYEDFYDDFYGESNYSLKDSDGEKIELCNQETDFEFDEESDGHSVNAGNDTDEDDDELRDQLDMHSMILSKSVYNENGEVDEPYITAEEVLNEIETMMTLQDEYYDEMTPDSGCFSVSNNNVSFSDSEGLFPNSNSSMPIDVNGSYITYIKTFAIRETVCKNSNQNGNGNTYNEVSDEKLTNDCRKPDMSDGERKKNKTISNKTDLAKFNIYELNDLIDQIEMNTKDLSDTLIHELALRDELEFDKETKNTFISLLMSIQEKRRLLNCENLSTSQYSNRSSNAVKKKHRRSMINLDSTKSTHLTTIIPYNNEVNYTVQHLQILNKLLKAIDEDSHQVPELLTNYILKVVCPT